jgi:hypothetical protein
VETTATSSPQGDSDADGDVTTATQDDSTGGYLTTMVGDSDGSSPMMATDDSSTMSNYGTDPTTTTSEGGDATTTTTNEEPDGGVTLDPFTTETDSGTGLSRSAITRNEWSPSCSSSECCSCRRLSLAAVARIEIVPAASSVFGPRVEMSVFPEPEPGACVKAKPAQDCTIAALHGARERSIDEAQRGGEAPS